jgi:hypothetical protein
MQPDYPAAHSMDSVWFAVDADGHVAAFHTGENGHIPAQGNEGYGMDELEALETARGLPKDEESEDGQRATKLGLFNYEYEDKLGHTLEPYRRSTVPKKPLHVDQLPAKLRKRMRQVTFSEVRFSKAKRVQPMEHCDECDSYDDLCSYLCADGKTVRPMPGEEDYFGQFVAWFREEAPEIARKLKFDGPLDVPEQDEEKEEDSGR